MVCWGVWVRCWCDGGGEDACGEEGACSLRGLQILGVGPSNADDEVNDAQGDILRSCERVKGTAGTTSGASAIC